jgi:uncharacterized membrane protein YhfC
LLTGMTGISLHMQWPLTSQLNGKVSRREQLFFLLRIKLHALSTLFSSYYSLLKLIHMYLCSFSFSVVFALAV